MELFNYRKSYTKNKLSMNDIGDNPIDFFVKWCKEAENSDQIIEPNAMTISTVDENSFPSSRVVLLKQIKERSLIFFTNFNNPLYVNYFESVSSRTFYIYCFCVASY